LPAKPDNFHCEKAQILHIFGARDSGRRLCATNGDITVFVFDYDMTLLVQFTSFIEPKTTYNLRLAALGLRISSLLMCIIIAHEGQEGFISNFWITKW
jgi:hypothetical protein